MPSLPAVRLVRGLFGPIRRALGASSASDGMREPRRRELEVTQTGDQLKLRLVVDGTAEEALAVWGRRGRDWFETGDFAVPRRGRESTTWHVAVDLVRLARRVRELNGERLDRERLGGEDAPGERVVLYLEVLSAARTMRAHGRSVAGAPADRSADRRLHYRDPIGRYDHTVPPTLGTIETDDGTVAPYVNRDGIISVNVGGRLQPWARLETTRVQVSRGVLDHRGRVETRHGDVTTARLVLQGRTTDFRAVAPAVTQLDVEQTSAQFGLRAYTYSARLDLAAHFRSRVLPDDTVDLYLELELSDGQTVRKRAGAAPFGVRRRSRGDHVTTGGTTVSITPYFTFHADAPSLQLELFGAQEHAHLRRLLRRNLPRRTLGSGSSRPVWVVGELPHKAQDNGLHFFRYLRDEHPEIEAYYVIRPGSPELRNLAGYEDHVLGYRSREHIDAVLRADRVIGSHDPGYLYPTRDPAFSRRVRAHKVFLQHGVTAAKWMVPLYGKEASGFDTDLVCVCSEREKVFFVRDLGYDPGEVVVTGFARFDTLLAEDVDLRPRQVLVMPTWRSWLTDLDEFTETTYFTRWNGLLRSGAVRELQERHGAEIVLCLHPNMQRFSHHFDGTDVHVVVQGEVNVQQLIKESAVMVTDYSSVAFDFAFLRKPVLFYQFDAERLPPPHVNPHAELPGTVARTEQGIEDALRAVPDEGWSMQEQHWERAKRFCRDRDRESCERIFSAVGDLHPDRSLATRVRRSEVAQEAYLAVRRHPRYLPVMRRLYRVFVRLPVDDQLIVFESGQGRHFADSPRYIYEELLRRGDTRRKVWIYNGALPVSDERTTVVPRHSIRFYWYLARAQYWVNNHTFPHYITRRSGGVYVQTWHGTPIKRMFHDQAGSFGRDSGYRSRVTRAVAQWSVLVSPSPYATACMRSAYRWDGPVAEIGYPRNDVLVDENAAERAARVRLDLGLRPGVRVVLYAPTFRDDKPTSAGRFAAQAPIDLEAFHRRFGEDHVLLLRTHVLVTERLDIPDGARGSVVDVSRYPDIQELLLVSDVLVTDYSSSFFDFALLGRPIVFYAYDLERYRDTLRGFYLDYDEDTLPGTIVHDEAGLLEALEVARGAVVPDETVLEFARRYAPQDDGRASSRVVDHFL